MVYYTDWTEEEHELLIKMFYAKVQITQMEEQFGRTRAEIEKELTELGILKRLN